MTSTHDKIDPMSVLRPHLFEGVPMSRAAAEAGVPMRTARRWLAEYRKNGPLGLRRKPRSDRGTRRILRTETVELIQKSAHEMPRRTIAGIHRLVVESCGEKGLPSPSYSTVRSIVAESRVDPPPCAYEETRDPSAAVIDRAPLPPARPNQVWIAAHTDLALSIRRADGRLVRPCLTAVVDVYSRAVAGYSIGIGSARPADSALALRHAIQVKENPAWTIYGVPETFEFDHGGDRTSVEIAETCAAMGIRFVPKTEASRYGPSILFDLFETVSTVLIPMLNGLSQQEPRRGYPRIEAISWGDLDSAIGGYISAIYHGRRHPETGQTPMQRWSESGFQPTLLNEDESLTSLLPTLAQRTIIQQDGVHVYGRRFVHPGLRAHAGYHVTVRFDPRNSRSVYIYHRNRYLCRATSSNGGPAPAATAPSQPNRNAGRP